MINPEKFEKRKNELKKYLINNPLPTKDSNAHFEDGGSMTYFLSTYKEKLIEDKEMKEIIKTKLNKNNQQQVKKVENLIKQVRDLIPLINSLNYNSKAELNRQINMSNPTFLNMLNSLKKYEPELHQEIEKLIDARINRVIEPTDEILNLLEKLKESKEKGTKFNIIDYTKIVDISLSELKKILNNINISNEDKKIIRTFISEYLGSSFKYYYRPNLLISQEITLKDKDGNMVTPTEKEREDIINFMNENSIPFLPATFNLLLREYVNGELNFEEIRMSKEKTKNNR